MDINELKNNAVKAFGVGLVVLCGHRKRLRGGRLFRHRRRAWGRSGMATASQGKTRLAWQGEWAKHSDRKATEDGGRPQSAETNELFETGVEEQLKVEDQQEPSDLNLTGLMRCLKKMKN